MTSLVLARAYQQSFDAHPSLTLAVTNGCLSALGDSVAQVAERLLTKKGAHDDPETYDYQRTLRFFCFGVGMGPLIGRWNKFLEFRFPLRAAGNIGSISPKALSKRVVCDQLMVAPLGLVLFIGSMGVMEGRDASHIRQRYVDMYPPALLANWQVWPLAQLINFRYMPLPYRVPFQSTCGVFWTLYLSLLNARADKKQHKVDQDHRTLDT